MKIHFLSTRAPGTYQLLLTNFIWVPVCIKKKLLFNYRSFFFIYAMNYATRFKMPCLL